MEKISIMGSGVSISAYMPRRPLTPAELPLTPAEREILHNQYEEVADAIGWNFKTKKTPREIPYMLIQVIKCQNMIKTDEKRENRGKND